MQTVTFDNHLITPSKIVCVGRNYVEHAKELGNKIPDDIVLFLKPNSAISNTLDAFHEEPLHYETELCFVVKDKTLQGVGLGLDLTKRQLQSTLKKAGLPWERAKAFDGSALFSEFVPVPENLEELTFTLEVDGDLRQKGNISQMLFDPQKVLSECQSFMTLNDGDILMTGTPKGVGEVVSKSLYSAKLFCGRDLLVDIQWQAT